MSESVKSSGAGSLLSSPCDRGVARVVNRAEESSKGESGMSRALRRGLALAEERSVIESWERGGEEGSGEKGDDSSVDDVRSLASFTTARLRVSSPRSVETSVGKLVMLLGALPVISKKGISPWLILIRRKESEKPTQRVKFGTAQKRKCDLRSCLR